MAMPVKFKIAEWIVKAGLVELQLVTDKYRRINRLCFYLFVHCASKRSNQTAQNRFYFSWIAEPTV